MEKNISLVDNLYICKVFSNPTTTESFYIGLTFETDDSCHYKSVEAFNIIKNKFETLYFSQDNFKLLLETNKVEQKTWIFELVS